MMRKCRVCGKEKPLTEYYKNPKSTGGKDTWCKACAKDRAEKYRRSKLGYNPRRYCEDCRTCEDAGCRHNKRTA